MSRRLNREWPCEAKGNGASILSNGSTTQVRLFGLEMDLTIGRALQYCSGFAQYTL